MSFAVKSAPYESYFHKNEREVLIPPGTCFHIGKFKLDYEENKDGPEYYGEIDLECMDPRQEGKSF